MRPKKGDSVEFKRGRIRMKGTIIAVSETGVHYLLKTDTGRFRHIGLSRIVQVLKNEG